MASERAMTLPGNRRHGTDAASEAPASVPLPSKRPSVWVCPQRTLGPDGPRRALSPRSQGAACPNATGCRVTPARLAQAPRRALARPHHVTWERGGPARTC